jgi:hypothetical protein
VPVAEDAFVWQRGVRIVGTRIWCDALRANGVCFVSHALARPAGRVSPHTRVIASDETARLCAAIGRPLPEGALLAPFARPFAVGRLRLELLPSGFVAGAAQLLVELPERRVLYAAGGLVPAEAQVRGCDAIALDVRAHRPLPRSRRKIERELLERAQSVDCDLPSLVAHALASGAGDVWLVGGGDERPFRAAGLSVHPLAPPEQALLFRP